MDKQYVTHIVLQQRRPPLLYSEREAAVSSHVGVGELRNLHALGMVAGVVTDGELRYSEEEVLQLRRIRRLHHDLGINLAGVEVIIRLLKRLEALLHELEQARNQAPGHSNGS